MSFRLFLVGKHICFYRFLHLKQHGKHRYFKSSSAVCLVNMKGRFKAILGRMQLCKTLLLCSQGPSLHEMQQRAVSLVLLLLSLRCSWRSPVLSCHRVRSDSRHPAWVLGLCTVCGLLYFCARRSLQQLCLLCGCTRGS